MACQALLTTRLLHTGSHDAYVIRVVQSCKKIPEIPPFFSDMELLGIIILGVRYYHEIPYLNLTDCASKHEVPHPNCLKGAYRKILPGGYRCQWSEIVNAFFSNS